MEHLNETGNPPELHLFNRIPEGLADTAVRDLPSVLPGPSLIHVRGRREPPLFLSILLHGNETTGFLALQQLLRTLELKSRPSPRSFLLFVGNVRAAGKGLRRLYGEPDYNRIWNGGTLPEHELARKVLDHVALHRPFAAVDIHNNTGKNPHYACINDTAPSFVHLARRFSKTIVYFTEPHEVISMALSRLCPSATLECGLSGDRHGTSHVHDYLLHCLTMEIDEIFRPPSNRNKEIYHTIAKITVPENTILTFCGDGRPNSGVCLRRDIEELNFTFLQEGTVLGFSDRGGQPLRIVDNAGKEVTEKYLRVANGEIVTRTPIIPSMFTRDQTVIRQDCFGYIMEPWEIESGISR